MRRAKATITEDDLEAVLKVLPRIETLADLTPAQWGDTHRQLVKLARRMGQALGRITP